MCKSFANIKSVSNVFGYGDLGTEICIGDLSRTIKKEDKFHGYTSDFIYKKSYKQPLFVVSGHGTFLFQKREH